MGRHTPVLQKAPSTTDNPLHDTIQSMVAALEMEIRTTDQTLAKQRGVLLSFGTRDDTPANQYRFKPARPPSDDTTEDWVLITTSAQRIAGRLVQWNADSVIWQTATDHGSEVINAKLVPDQTQLLHELKRRLVELINRADQEGGTGPNWDLIRQTLNQMPPQQQRTKRRMPKMPELNDRQRQAVSGALTNSLTLLWGPPGTGKTTTLAHMLTALAEAGQTVLLISNTNVAVDAALGKVVQLWHGHPKLEAGAVQRLGSNYTAALTAPEVCPYVIPDQIVARRSIDIQAKLTELRQKREAAEHDAYVWESLQALEQDIASQAAQAETKTQQIATMQQNARHLESQWTRRQHAIHRWEQGTVLVAALARNRVSKLRDEYHQLYTQWTTTTTDCERLETERNAHCAAHDLAKEKLQTLLARYGIKESWLPEATRFAESARMAAQRLAKLEREQEQKLEALVREIQTARRVTATTLTQAFREMPERMRADVVIVDEVSMALLPTIVYAAGLARQAVVYIGDFRQLPPVVLTNHELTDAWLRRDVFMLHRVPEALAQGKMLPYLVALNEQHRMDKAICDTVNTLFYPDSPLITKVHREEPASRAFPTGALLYVDTGPWASFTQRGLKGTSKTNPLHAATAVALVRTLLERGDSGIGVTTPYRPQVAAIQAAMEEAKLAEQVMVDTIHRYQGSERPVMILDLSDAPGTPPSQFMQADSLDDDGARLLNVALTRAQQQVIVVANMAYLRESKSIPERALSRKLAAYIQLHGKELALEHILPTLEGDGLWGQLTADITAAGKDVQIWIPHLTPEWLQRANGWWTALATQQVSVTVITRPPQQQTAPSAIVAQWLERLRKQGITVKTEAYLVKSLIIVDRYILWFFSELLHNSQEFQGFRWTSTPIDQHL